MQHKHQEISALVSAFECRQHTHKVIKFNVKVVIESIICAIFIPAKHEMNF